MGKAKAKRQLYNSVTADILLNYAEALAELDGAANASKIKEALRPLRERVGMRDGFRQRVQYRSRLSV